MIEDNTVVYDIVFPSTPERLWQASWTRVSWPRG